MSTEKNVGVIGAGQMGSGIAQVFLENNYYVFLHDVNEALLELAKEKIKFKLKNNKLINNLQLVYKIKELINCDFIIEAVFETYEAKKEILFKLSEVVNEKTIIATNTSALSINELAKYVNHPERFIGFHFMNPPNVIKLIEIIKGDHTSNDVFNYCRNLAQKLNKTPIESKNSTAFILNRILVPMINEAIYVLYEGLATAEVIDKALVIGAQHKMGPLSVADFVGLDVILAIMNSLFKSFGEKYKPCPLLEQYVQQGKLGRKTGVGFFSYSNTHI